MMRTQISLFQNAFQTDAKETITVAEFVNQIRRGEYDQAIKAIRKAKHHPEVYSKMKPKLPAVTLSALLKHRKHDAPLEEKLISHSGLLQIDIDKVPDLHELREKINRDPFTFISFISPGGDGLKIAIRIDPSKHLESFHAAERYYRDKFSVTIDPSVKDVTRLCFVSHDPFIFVNEQAKIMRAADHQQTARGTTSAAGGSKFSKRAFDAAGKIIQQSTDGQKHYDLYKAARLLGGYVAGGVIPRSDAVVFLQEEIQAKPNVHSLQGAFKTIDDGLNDGAQEPIFLERLEEELAAFLKQSTKQSRAEQPEQDDQPEQDPKLDFPVEVMSGAAGRFAEIYSDHLEPPPQFFYMAYLTCLGAVISDRATIDSAIQPRPRLYTLLLGESADDRKSTAIDQTVSFFKKTLIDGFCTCHGTGSAEGLQRKLSKNNRLLLVFDEFKQFVSKCKIDGSVLLPCVNTLYESNRYESQTSKHAVDIQDAQLSLLAASTIATYDDMWTANFTDIGFNNRLFLVTGHGARKYAIPKPIALGDRKALEEDLVHVLSGVPSGTVFPTTSTAVEMFEGWYMGLEQSVHAKRIDGYALRLMPLLAANDRKDTIDEDTVRKAMTLCDWQLHVRKAHDPIDADSEMAKMEQRIRKYLQKTPSGLRDRELKRSTNANRHGVWLYQKARDNLLKCGDIRFYKPLKRYILNSD